ncbi:MAG TPA: VOC family protein [Chthoniobacteraceae bacterium]|jgi:PhnB protein|nr:VOC family protein [Chthoniobacteraceae bacterium]
MAKPNTPKSVQPYLFFEGTCEEALEFYRTSIGAEDITLLRCKESPVPYQTTPEKAEKIMHGSFRIGETTIFASDGRCEEPREFKGFSLTINLPDKVEAERVFAALSQEGKVQMPLTETFFSPYFGMVDDRFGISWMIMVPKEA